MDTTKRKRSSEDDNNKDCGANARKVCDVTERGPKRAKADIADNKSCALYQCPLEILLQICTHIGLQDILSLRAAGKLFKRIFPYPCKKTWVKHENYAKFVCNLGVKSKRIYADALLIAYAADGASNNMCWTLIYAKYRRVFPYTKLQLEDAARFDPFYAQHAAVEIPLEDKWFHPYHGLLTCAIRNKKLTGGDVGDIVKQCFGEWRDAKLCAGSMHLASGHSVAIMDSEICARLYCMAYAYRDAAYAALMLNYLHNNMFRYGTILFLEKIKECRCANDAPEIVRLLIMFNARDSVPNPDVTNTEHGTAQTLAFTVNKHKRTAWRSCTPLIGIHDCKVVWKAE